MKRPKITWIGSKNHGEFHRVEAGKPQPAGCQLDEILEEHRITFKTAREARTARPGRRAFDACAYCTKRFKSRR